MMLRWVTNAATVTQMLSTEHLFYSCIHILIRACVSPHSFSQSYTWRGWRSMRVPSNLEPIHHLHCPKLSLISPRFPMIFNHAPVRLTLNFELTRCRGERAWRSHCLFYNEFLFFYHWLIRPFTLLSPHLKSLWSELYHYPSICTDC